MGMKRKLAVLGLVGSILFAVVCVLLALSGHDVFAVVLVIGYIAACLLMMFDLAVYRALAGQKAPFQAMSRIRNVDTLLIGDVPSSLGGPSLGSYVVIKDPCAGLESSYELLRHTHSILKENGGRVVIYCSRRHFDDKTIAIGCLHFLHRIEVKRLSLEKETGKLRFLPLLVHPLQTLRFMFSSGHVIGSVPCPRPDMNSFCVERGIDLEIIEMR